MGEIADWGVIGRIHTPPRRLAHGEKVPTEPMWKRVSKDRAKRKAAKQQKKQMRSR